MIQGRIDVEVWEENSIKEIDQVEFRVQEMFPVWVEEKTIAN